MRAFLVALGLSLASLSAFAQTYVLTQPGAPTSAGTGQMSLAVTTATLLSLPIGTRAAQVTVESASVRCRDDGTAPTSSTGVLYQAGTVITEWLPALANFQCIQVSGTATLDVAYYK